MDECKYFEQFVGDTTVDREYQEYLGRFYFLNADWNTPLTYFEFIAACRRWDEEYNAAWDNYQGIGIPPVALELESLLAI